MQRAGVRPPDGRVRWPRSCCRSSTCPPMPPAPVCGRVDLTARPHARTARHRTAIQSRIPARGRSRDARVPATRVPDRGRPTSFRRAGAGCSWPRPAGWVPSRASGSSRRGAIVGADGIHPGAAEGGRAVPPTGWLVDTMVLDRIARRPSGSRLMVQAHEEQPFSLSLGQTAEMREIQLRLGWKQVAPLQIAQLVVNARAGAAGQAAEAGGVGRRARPEGDARGPRLDGRRPHAGRASDRPLRRAPRSAVDRGLAPICRVPSCATRRI